MKRMPAGRIGVLMECGLTLLLAAELLPDLNADEVREGQLLALTLGLPCAVVLQVVLWLAL
ncbi:hypothetical protein V1290_002119 [Bradyrhizobium sp. AZCC 1578]|uniref:hypothetical protein n=1 Tax=Bradyrhizobium sp. AZCC 1578 TaxID=3117027 RepID=UPI002FF21275